MVLDLVFYEGPIWASELLIAFWIVVISLMFEMAGLFRFGIKAEPLDSQRNLDPTQIWVQIQIQSLLILKAASGLRFRNKNIESSFPSWHKRCGVRSTGSLR